LNPGVKWNGTSRVPYEKRTSPPLRGPSPMGRVVNVSPTWSTRLFEAGIFDGHPPLAGLRLAQVIFRLCEERSDVAICFWLVYRDRFAKEARDDGEIADRIGSVIESGCEMERDEPRSLRKDQNGRCPFPTKREPHPRCAVPPQRGGLNYQKIAASRNGTSRVPYEKTRTVGARSLRKKNLSPVTRTLSRGRAMAWLHLRTPTGPI
jgi:hypothetical protein